MVSNEQRLEMLLDRHGRSFSEELGIDLTDGTPSALWQWLVASLLMSARISTDLAVEAARELFSNFGTTSRSLADTTWKQRVDVLNASGYARYDERTSAMLGDVLEVVGERYRHDLRNLREEADRDPERERALLTELKGIGDVGADIFFREVQTIWDELHPFADDAALRVADRLGLGSSAEELDDLVGRRDLPRLLSALVRADHADEIDAIAAGERPGTDAEARSGDLRERTKDELYDLARERDVEGRSDMTKAELVDALRG